MYLKCRELGATFVFTILTAISVTSALSDDLAACLQDIKSSNMIYLSTPSSPIYNSERKVFNNIFNNKPSAIFHPISETEAASAVVCAASRNISITPRSGGHSYEGYSGGNNGSLVIDFSQFRDFSIDHDSGVATVGAGIRIGPLFTMLWEAGEYLIPAGTCPGVGIGGHALGGGMGMTSRKYGMLSDNVVEMTMIDSKGKIRKVNKVSNPDLFWALRGAGGGSFGLVTEFKIQLHRAPSKVTLVQVTYPWDMHQTVIHAFTIWTKDVVNDFTPLIYLDQHNIHIWGTFLGPEIRAQSSFDSLFDVIGEPRELEYNEVTWFQAAAKWAEMQADNLENPLVKNSRSFSFRSLLYRHSISKRELEIITKYIKSPPKTYNGEGNPMVLIESWGGKIDDPDSPSAFDNHRGTLYSIQYGVGWESGTVCSECVEWSKGFAKELQEAHNPNHALEAYQNYIERDITNGLETYYGNSLPRLIKIKNRVDPGNVFRFPQSIPLN